MAAKYYLLVLDVLTKLYETDNNFYAEDLLNTCNSLTLVFEAIGDNTNADKYRAESEKYKAQ